METAHRRDESTSSAASHAQHSDLRALIEHAAHLLPAQGPISVFIHHNTLHAFEDKTFEEAVVIGGQRFGCQPFLSEERFREELERGRILVADLRRVLEEDLGPGADASLVGLTTRLDLRMAMVQHLFAEPTDAELAWLLSETGALDHLRRDLPDDTRRLLIDRARVAHGRDRSVRALETLLVRDLWAACYAIASRAAPPPPPPRPRLDRLRDLIQVAVGVDTHDLVHPLMIRLAGAFLDQGIAYWSFPERDRGFYTAFLSLYADISAERWARDLREVLAEERAAASDPLSSVERSLAALGVQPDERESVVTSTLLALRGWAGMFWQVETRPDRMPVHVPLARLVDFLAVYLLLERGALRHVARVHLGHRGPLAELKPLLTSRVPPPPSRRVSARAGALFQVAQFLGLDGPSLSALDPTAADSLLREIEAFGGVERRRIFHLAYERRHRLETLDALAVFTRDAPPVAEPPAFQAVFCIDEREESIRRHLEEVEPRCETLGFAGFFGVAMYYRGVEDAHPVPLCPIVIRPDHEVEEVVEAGDELRAELRARGRRVVGRLSRGLEVGTRTFARGTLLTAVLGILAVVPLVFRVLLPRLTATIRRTGEGLMRAPKRTHLALDRRHEVHPHLGKHAGFTKDEMAAIVRGLLENTGLARRLAPLVLIVGHGSNSLNNPHESAHDCGACGGGRGGPNARAFAQMANDPEVRARLAAQGLEIPPGTWFVGSIHNTCDDVVIYFDADRVPPTHQAAFAQAKRALDTARAYNAHERCRRFESAASWLPPVLALAHVMARVEDLAQVRPEYGHATNAVCLVGRRHRTRGLFLDRRAFLVSYDPTAGGAPGGEDGTILARLLGAVVPVCAGISLEYYFSHVDPTGYGCGTKLPHNITGLLGVMDGAASDLRTGLPWQMVEIHEPVRLLMVIEAEVEVLQRVIAGNPTIAQLVKNRWVQIAALDPEGPWIRVLRNGVFEEHTPENTVLATAPSSAAWYRGRRDHLPCARITADVPAPAPPQVWNEPSVLADLAHHPFDEPSVIARIHRGEDL